VPELTLDLQVRDGDGQLIADPTVFVRVAPLDGVGAAIKRVALTGQPAPLTFPDGPPGFTVILRISPSRYHDAQMNCNVDGDGRILPVQEIRVPRRSGDWVPAFTQWASLPGEFGTLKEALGGSPVFRLGRTSDPGTLVEHVYDGVPPTDESRALAKMSLLNLYARLRSEAVPGQAMAWFSLVEELLLATRERVVAGIDEACYEAVRALAKKPRDGYKKSNAENHRGNFEALPDVTHVKGLASVKTKEAKANLQLTVAEATRAGKQAFLLDADLDENGRLLRHGFDLITHVFSGGTHPIDIHEALRVLFPGDDIGYGLEPKLAPVFALPRITTTTVFAVPGAMAPLTAPADVVPPAAMAVVGDSVTWGQGLLESQKMHRLVAGAFGAGASPPGVTLVAHSGAVIGVGVTHTQPAADGEVPKAHPTILRQCQDFPAVPAAAAELVVLNGGINDVDIRFILSPFTDAQDLEDTTVRACGADLLALLRRAAQTFPKARTIAVLEYYPILSSQSRFTWGVEFLSALGAPPPPMALFGGALPFSFWDRIVENCRVFHAASTSAIRAAVAQANLDAGGQTFVAIDPGFKEENAALAPEAWLFGVNWDLSPQDPVAPHRRMVCVRDEADPFRRFGCFLASAGHPNPLGAQAYATAIVAAMAEVPA
jgi:hypothetical protein